MLVNALHMGWVTSRAQERPLIRSSLVDYLVTVGRALCHACDG